MTTVQPLAEAAVRGPAVTVAIPTYRGSAFIGAAIESVLLQSFTDFELVIIDDNSPDATQAIVEGYTDGRVSYIRNERNLGPQAYWERHLDLVIGDPGRQRACGRVACLI